jgi:carboxypeptidase family protein/TonB-dependent receptor-like protein
MRFKCAVVSVSAILCLMGTAFAQDPRGSIRGRVVDSSNASVPGAAVSAVNAATGIRAAVQTNQDGMYSIPFLPPGLYTVTAELTGFSPWSRSSVQVRVSETTELNIAVGVGAVSERVEVKAGTPLLDTASASLGQIVDARRIQELPIAAGNALELTLLAPGMIEPSKFTWKAAWNFRNIASDGNPSFTTEYQIDGVSNTFAEGNTGRNRYAFAPPAAAISEFKMQTTPYDASIGHTMSSLVNVSTASGTNQLHGEAHIFTKNSDFDAPNFFNNKNNTKKPKYEDNRYGISAGGPVVIPGVYNGRNKTFWHYVWEANKWAVPQTFTGTVPTEAQRRGDFSGLLALGPNYQIYDPATTQVLPGGRYGREPFPNNIIPQNRLNEVGLNLVKLYPLPNAAGTSDGRNNYFNGSLKGKQDYWVHMFRGDHAWTPNHRMFARVHYDRWEEDKDHWFGDNVNGIILNRTNFGFALDDVLVLNPTLVLNLRYGLTDQDFLEHRASQGFDLGSLGFSPELTALVDRRNATIPRVSAGDFSSFSGWESGDGFTTSLTHSFGAHFTKLRGNHNLKFGSDFRIYHADGNRFPRQTAPDLSFDNTFTRGPFDNSSAAPLGQELAALLLGIPSGAMERTEGFEMIDRFFGVYLQDDVRVSSKLTLNLGLRYEYETPLVERADRLVGGFAFDAANPVEAAARINYAAAPIPDLPADQFRARGGLYWVNQNGSGRSPFNGEKNNVMPRIGLAYRLMENTIVRAGYGMYIDTIGVNSTRAIQTGFSQTTPIQASLDQGLTFVASAANPFPNGLLPPLGSAGGLETNLGQSLEFYLPERKHPYSQRWSVGVQQLLPWQFVGEATYVGSRGTRLPVIRELNATPAQYLSTSATRDQGTIDHLSATFPNPFFGTNPIFGSRISRADLLRPYPQFESITVSEPLGSSWYHALQTRAERRMANGFTFQLGYTFSKLMEATQFLNPTDPMPYKSIGALDRTHRLTMSGIWEIPVGRGHRFGAKLPAVLNLLAGDWQLGAVVVRQSGAPLGFGNVPFSGVDLNAIALPKDERSVERWFNTEAGFNRDSSQQLSYNIRTTPLRFAEVRGDGRATWDFSLIKNVRLADTTLQFRAEVYNAWNHPNFNNPVTSPVDSAFGQIFGAGEARNLQFSLKLKF